MKKYDSKISLLFAGMLVSALLAGCSGGGSSSSASAPQTPTPSSIKVTASLGKFSLGTTVKLKKTDGTEIGSGTVLADGTSTITLPPNYSGPIVVEVLGGTGVTYFDEKTATDVPFASGKALRAVMPLVRTTVGVTPLTHAAVARLGATLANATPESIGLANTKIAQVFGLSDILLAPTPVSLATGNTLNVATQEDKYALVLAALAHTAAGSANAADVADALALDLKDDKLDGLDGTSTTPTVALAAYTPANIAAQYQAAALDFADTTSQTVIAANPIVIDTDVGNIVVVTNQSDVSLAKAMFADLRTTATSLSNVTKTGFLDTKASSMSADLTTNVAPDMGKVAGRFAAFDNAVKTFEDRNAVTSTNSMGFMQDYDPTNSTTPAPVLVRMTGDFNAVMYGYGSADYCWTPTATPVTTVSCAHAGPGSADFINSQLKMVVFTLTSTGTTNSYTYTATRMNLPVAFNMTSFAWGPTGILTGTTIPVGSGNFVKTVSGTSITSLTVDGTLPPSTLATGVDKVQISAARTALTGSNYRYSLFGLVASANINPAITTPNASISIDLGSYFDLDETNMATTGGKMLGGNFIITAKTAKTQFTGTLVASAMVADADGMESMPASIVFNGAISDISSGGAGQVLTGKMELNTTDFNLFHSLQPLSTSNYRKQAVTFTGTVQAPSRPLMTLVVAGNMTGFTTSSVTLNYSYGTVSITGNAAVDSTSLTNTLTLSNQDGVQVVISEVKSTPTAAAVTTGVVNRSSAKVADITSSGIINYVDGFSETLN